MANSRKDLFEYTSGNWVYNDALRHKERRLALDVDGRCRLAAESVNPSPADVVNLSKLAEGGFNRTPYATTSKWSPERWDALTGGVPCPVELDAEDARKTRKLNKVQAGADRFFEMWQNMVGLGEEGWVPTEDYEDAVALFEGRKEEALAGTKSAEERAEIMELN